MATRQWNGSAIPVTQVTTIQVTAYDVATTYSVTLNLKTISVIAAGSVAATAAALATAWGNVGSADFQEVSASSNGVDTLVLTAVTAGKPFTVTKAVSGGAGTLGSVTAATACSGPNFWDIAANWVENSVPAAGDDVIINAGPSILYNIDQNAVTLTSLTVGPNYPSSSQIGLPSSTSPSNPSAGYPEYRTQRLKIGATTCTINSASTRMRLDLTPASSTTIVLNTGQPTNPGEDALDLAVAATANIYLRKGTVGLNYLPGDTATAAIVDVSYLTSVASDVKLRCGKALTITALKMSGGTVELNNGATTITKYDGQLTLLGGAVTTFNNYGGLLNYDGTGTLTTLNNGGQVIRRGLQGATITTLVLLAGSTGDDRDGTLTYTNAVQYSNCRPPVDSNDRGADVAWWCFGRGRTATIT